VSCVEWKFGRDVLVFDSGVLAIKIPHSEKITPLALAYTSIAIGSFLQATKISHQK